MTIEMGSDMTYYRYRELKEPLQRYVGQLLPGSQRILPLLEGSLMLVLATTVALYVY